MQSSLCEDRLMRPNHCPSLSVPGLPAPPSPTDSCLAVDKHRATSRSRQVDEVKSLLEILLQVLVAAVRGMQLLVGDRFGHVVGRGDCRHIEHMVDSETGESSSVAGILHVAKEEEGGDLAGRAVL